MNILITGGLGFIGSNLAKKLIKDNNKITIIDNLIPEYGGNLANVMDIKDEVSININDLRDTNALKQLLKGIDVIYNLAAQTGHTESMLNPINDLNINSKAQLSLLEVVREVCPEAIVVYSSTRQVYGKPDYLPVDEAHKIKAVDINGINKFAGEQFHILYNDVYKIRSTVLRLTNTYGPGMRIKDARQIFLGVWIKSLLTDNPILVYGDGSQIRDFNYVDDVVDALIKASNNKDCFGKVMNLGSDQIINLESLAKKLTSYIPGSNWKKIPFPKERKAIDIGDYYSNYKFASNLLNWQPKVNLDKGLKATIDFYKKNLNYYL
ncbi:NAD-dependent epimerase/dehydratase family protein [Prochlorococcus sp. MIT 1223]|uniref:NAD-dependent epimerase/dehydratase family protein n=1 Tax=Prochlorococcus sp. MIT 1223 TaxID=3096217 RepID=UPI002A763D9E|nr:NAD-dependent epimerase/dehydratase family protein [Prochlorococcus sp. MIT 1223]